jgi:hypothetical protein
MSARLLAAVSLGFDAAVFLTLAGLAFGRFTP